MTRKLLVVDDDESFGRSLAELLATEGYEVDWAGSSESALESLAANSYHLVLTDLQMPGADGVSLVTQLRTSCPGTRVVMITGHGSIKTSVAALKEGADDYLLKPIKPRQLTALVHALLEQAPDYVHNRLLADDRRPDVRFGRLHARSQAMISLFGRARQLAGTRLPVLVTGPTGSGKTELARAIHDVSGNGALILINLRSPEQPITNQILDEILSKGEGGTLVFEEITYLEPKLQRELTQRIARGLDSNNRSAKSSARFIFTADGPLDPQAFDPRLTHVLQPSALEIPALRGRLDDVYLIAADLIDEFSSQYGKKVTEIPAETLRLLQSYPWPGNVRELRSVIEQAVVLATDTSLEPHLLPKMIHGSKASERLLTIAIPTTIDSVEREVILRTLEAHEWNKTAAAEALGLSRRSIYNKLEAYGIQDPAHDPAVKTEHS